MTVSLKHKFTSAKSDSADASLIRPSNWNDEHDLTLATDRLLGRDSTGTGSAEEITVAGGLEFTGTGGIQRSALTGDVTAAAGSDTTTIANDAVTYAKIQNVSTNDKILGRASAGAGDIEEIDCTAAGRALLDDADAAAQRTTLAAAGTGVSNTFTANQIISVTDNTNAALRITQLGTGNALVVEDSTNPDATPFVVDANGRLFIGTTTYLAGWNTSQNVVLAGTTNPGISIFQAANNTAPGVLTFNKSRGTTPGDLTAVASGDTLGVLNFAGADGYSAVVTAAQLRGEVDGTPGLDDMPGRLTFFTTADGASSPSERMRIDRQGYVGINTTAPEYYLDIKAADNTATTTALAVQNNSRNYGVGIGAYQLTNRNIGGTATTVNYTFDIGGDAIFNTNNAEAMRITDAGAVGIGTNAPSYRLDVVQEGDATARIKATNTQGGTDNDATLIIDAAVGGEGVVQFLEAGVEKGVITLFQSGNRLQIETTTGSNNAIAFYPHSAEAMRITPDGKVGIGTSSPSWPLTVAGDIRTTGSGEIFATGTGRVGYGSGAGGTVTQTTSRSTAVTLNKTTGRITLVSAAATTAWTSFTVNNSLVSASDTIVVNQRSGARTYTHFVSAVAAGSFEITFAATSGTTTEQPAFAFAILSGNTA